MILTLLAQAVTDIQHIRWTDLGLDPVLLSIGGHPILRWYSLAYIGGILVGWWYLLKLLAQPGAPMAKRHADDLVFYATIGIILGGRLGYVLFYAPGMLLDPLQVFKLWDGGMSFHGGVIGTSLAMILLARRHGLAWLRVHDYIACCVPFGLFFGRIANFINGELWGKPTNVAWAIIFPRTGNDVARHPSQLYEAGLEGLVLFAILWFCFWKTRARYDPGKLTGIFLVGYGCARFFVEFFREPDSQFTGTFFATTIHMGQVLCIPMILGGIYLIATSAGRRHRVEPIAGGESVA
ncbi:prolipoprotein diacylglyceryl transferase [Hephaestia sp. GCM10023244]|uniref:prolipoprotein diacylglyceryl transferase n=1 Tax=unclassified Hephaestia TaxID=2631281 RepID=UPI002076E39C|nr:prolipoprotein diacylglyceryl transferase [Hephaestia sp. MAHUQ-44]MCM8732234.1 prolipoprotein diacylglyceryl transferase [Hephaestia sp. MAHUQ-44]